MQVPLLTIVIPVYDDWACLRELLPRISTSVADLSYRVRVLLVDDCSPAPYSAGLIPPASLSLERVEILQLRCNLGHQRAIAMGIAHLSLAGGETVVAVMDSDGEDRPEDLPALLKVFEENRQETVVFAARARRLEVWWFQLSYHLYRYIHWLLTGIAVRVGNFSVCPWPAVRRLAVMSETWNHFAASVFRSKFPFQTTHIDRGRRISGKSRMGFTPLVAHGLSAISVFSDIVAVRLLVASIVLLLVGMLTGALWSQGLWTDGSVSASSGLAVLLLLNSLFFAVALTAAFAVFSLSRRSSIATVPEEIYRHYYGGTSLVASAASGGPPQEPQR